MQYSKIKFAVGLFTIIFVLVVSGYMYIILKEKGIFDKRYSYNFNTKSAKDFSVGMPLNFSGFNIGVIDDISLKDDGTVQMVFSVNAKNLKWLRKDSVLKMSKPLIGSPFIEVESTLTQALLKEGATLQIVQNDDINDMISKMEPVVEKIIKIIDSVDKITMYLARDDSEIINTLKNVEKFSAKLANESLITNAVGDRKAAKDIVESIDTLNQSMKDIKAITKNMSDISASVDKEIIKPSSAAIKEVNAIMKDVKHKLQMLDGTVKSVGSYDKDLVEIKEQITLAIEKSNQLMGKVDAFMQDKEQNEVILP